MTKERACANGTGLSRRTLLTMLPATAAALAFPASACPFDPILPLYREWCASRAEWLRLADMPGNGDWDFPESIAAEKRENAAYDAMIDLTPVSPEGIAALVHILWDTKGPSAHEASPHFPEQYDRPGNKLIRAIWRGVGGQGEYPRA